MGTPATGDRGGLGGRLAGPDDSSRFGATLSQGLQRVPWTPSVIHNGRWVRNGQWVTTDLNGDRRTDFALVKPSGLFWFQLHIAFTLPDGGYQGHHQNIHWNQRVPVGFTPTLFVDDVDGDGINDLTLFGEDPRGGGRYVTAFGGEASGGPLRQSVPGLFVPFHFPSADSKLPDMLMGDVTGDGLADLVAIAPRDARPDCGIAVRPGIGNGSGRFDFDSVSKTKTTCLPGDLRDRRARPRIRAEVQLADHNGDLKADIVAFQPGSADEGDTARVTTAIADGTGGFHTDWQDAGQAFAETREEIRHPPAPYCRHPQKPNEMLHECFLVVDHEVPSLQLDVDGDGRSDLVVLVPGPDGRAAAWTMFSRGDGTYRGPTFGSTPFSANILERIIQYWWPPHSEKELWVEKRVPRRPLVADFNGDGARDLGLIDGTGGNGVVVRRGFVRSARELDGWPGDDPLLAAELLGRMLGHAIHR